jgi:hypothetical protein
VTEMARLLVRVEAAGADDEELDRLTGQLLDEVRETDVEAAGPVAAGPAPAGAKSGGLESIGLLAVQVLPAAIPALVGLLRDWAGRGPGRDIKLRAQLPGGEMELEYPVGSLSPEQLKVLVDTVTGSLRTAGGPDSTG